jgi:L-fucose mutarotase/ribose pyranase (RbsD/FucU family)
MKLAILVLVTAASSLAQQKPWRQILDERLPYYGNGNWIVVADSAFPLRSTPGIETIISNDSQVNTVRHVLNLFSNDAHVRPIIYNDMELKYVAEQDAPGISAYRQLLAALVEKFLPQPPARSMRHADMMRVLDDAAKSFNVLMIKTSMALPYTSVFLELRAGYWPDDAEQRLRESIP